MRASISTLALLAVATSTCAELAKVANTSDTAYYVDPTSLSDTGNVRRVPVIQDYANEQPSGVRSRQVVYEIDCANERLRSVAVSEYAEPMARGTATNAWQRESDWLYVGPKTGTNIPPSTPYRPIVRFVCSR